MCGIFSAISFSGDIDRKNFKTSLDKIAHRGPDDADMQFFSQKGGRVKIGFGHRRLSIFDLSRSGRQPMQDGHGYWLVFNGEIFNWPELRKELEAYGHCFHTETDSEVVLAAYRQWGDECVTRFNGFWAFLIFDSNTQSIFASRDRFGIKPLYICRDDSGILLSSEIAPIWHYRKIKPSVNLQQLSRYLVLDLSHDSRETIYDGVEELEPGYNCKIDLASGSCVQVRYWELPINTCYSAASDDELLQEFSFLIEDSVRLRLRSDREVALTLSGGIDSSVIAVAASRISDTKIKAYTSHFSNHPELDESSYAMMVAQRCGLDHILVEPDTSQLFENEQALTQHQELMYTSFSQLINWFVVKEIASSNTRVYLTGQGGDEVFLGYERYGTSWISSQFKQNPIRGIKAMSDMARNSRMSWREVIGFQLYFSNQRVRTFRYKADAKRVFSNQIMDRASELAIDIPSNIAELQQLEIVGSQLRRLLRYDDRTSSAFGIEARPVFLDHRLVEFSSRLDWDQKIRNGWTKNILRRYLDQAGLPEIAWRKHKLGYAAPTQEWTEQLIKHFQKSHSDRARLDGILKRDFQFEKAPKRLQFKIYNLMSSAAIQDWNNV